MAIKDIFKKKAAPQQQELKKQAAEKPEIKTEGKEEKQEAVKAPKKTKKTKLSLAASKILVSPKITEKSMELANSYNQYIFRVKKPANKIGIKKAIQDLYGVEVEKVRIVNVPRKQRRLGKTIGWKKGYKKAIVSVKSGQKIDIDLG